MIIWKILRIHGKEQIISLKAKDSESPKIIKIKHGKIVIDPKLITDNLTIFFAQ